MATYPAAACILLASPALAFNSQGYPGELQSPVQIGTKTKAGQPSPQYTFQNIAWGTSTATVKTKLSEKYEFQSEDDNGLNFSGKLGDLDCVLRCSFTNAGKLVSVLMIFGPFQNKLSTQLEFIKVAKGVVSKYGKADGGDLEDENPVAEWHRSDSLIRAKMMTDNNAFGILYQSKSLRVVEEREQDKRESEKFNSDL